MASWVSSRERDAKGIDTVFNGGFQVGGHPPIDQILLERNSCRAMLVDPVTDRVRM